MRFRLVFYICFIFISYRIYSQNETYNTIAAGYNDGFNVNAGSDRQFGKTKPCGAEIVWTRKKTGSKYWEQIYNLPSLGWKMNWYDHRNAILGNTFAISRTIDFTLIKTKRVDFTLRASQGLMYATRYYQTPSSNSERYNNAIGQAINFSEELGLGCDIHLNRKVSIKLNVLVTHYSSGAIAQPNDGLNLVSFQGGICYKYGYKKVELLIDSISHRIDKNIRFNASVGAGLNQLNSTNTKKYPLVTVMLYADKQINQVSKLNSGLDLYMNTAIQHEIDNDTMNRGKDFKRVGFGVGYELLIDRVGIVLQAGYQFYSPYPAKHSFYQKFGLKYYINKSIFAVVMLRGYKFGVSDELSWGFGVRI